MQKKNYKGREKIIEGFKNEIFPLNYDEEEKKESTNKKEENDIRNENGLIDYEKLKGLIHLKNIDINNGLVRTQFLVQDLGALLKKLKKSENNPERNDIQENLVKNGLRDLREEIEDMSEQEKEIRNPNEIVDIVDMDLDSNRQQQSQWLKILT